MSENSTEPQSILKDQPNDICRWISVFFGRMLFPEPQQHGKQILEDSSKSTRVISPEDDVD
jgi:hypothetical protein